MKKIFFCVILGIMILFTSGCFDWNNLNNATIYTTVYPINFLSETLYKEHSKSSSIYPNGSLPSEYSLTEKQINDYSKGTLFIYNGATNEKQIAKSLYNKNKKLKIIDVAQGLKINYEVEELWLSPSNFLMLATNLKNNLESLVGSKYVNEEIEKNYQELEETLSIMDADMRKIAKDAKENNKNTLIATSKVFKFLENYGFNVICLEDYLENQADINTLKNSFSSNTYHYLLKKNYEPDTDIIKGLETENKAVIINVNMMNTLSDNDDKNNYNYLSIMNDFILNLKTIVSN